MGSRSCRCLARRRMCLMFRSMTRRKTTRSDALFVPRLSCHHPTYTEWLLFILFLGTLLFFLSRSWALQETQQRSMFARTLVTKPFPSQCVDSATKNAFTNICILFSQCISLQIPFYKRTKIKLAWYKISSKLEILERSECTFHKTIKRREHKLRQYCEISLKSKNHKKKIIQCKSSKLTL